MNKEEDQNIIDLLKQALAFYSNEENYNGTKDNISLIAMDRGHQARFAFKQIKELEGINKDIEAEYYKLTNEVESEDSPENLLKIINNIKNIGNGD